MDPPLDAAHGALDLRMPGVADQDHLVAPGGVALALVVHLGHQRAGGIDHREAALVRGALDRLGDAMRAEHRDRSLRDLVDLVHEARALALQRLDHVPVVDDLVADVDRRPEAGQRPLDDLDRALDAGTEPARLGEDDTQRGLGHPASPPRDQVSGAELWRGWLRSESTINSFTTADEASCCRTATGRSCGRSHCRRTALP